MPKRTILRYPNEILKSESIPVSLPLEEETLNLVQDLKDTCTVEGGVGISAPQVGINKRVIIVTHDGELTALINPEIISYEGTLDHKAKEGCLSFPGLFVKIKRFDDVIISYYDEEGNQHEKRFSGLTSQIVQHEIDHLNGLTMLDRMHRLERDRYFRKQKRQAKKLNNMIKRIMSSVK